MTSKYPRQTRPAPSSRPAGNNMACLPWIALLPDAAEGLLGDVEQRTLDLHLSSCLSCSEELAEAQRGLAWLNVLKDQVPEPPARLLTSILAQTTGVVEVGVSLPELPPYLSPADLAFVGEPEESFGQQALRWLRGDRGTWSTLLQPRLAMTGAMAFFSICLTLNLLGISVTQLDPQSLRKGNLHRTVSDTGTSLLHSLQGLRVVYRVESRVNELRAQRDEPEQMTSVH